MGRYFAYEYSGPAFVQWGAAHLAALMVLLAAAAFLWRWQPSARLSRRLRIGLALVLLLNELGWHAWHAHYGLWTVQALLPLNICNLMVFASVWALLTINRPVYEFVYLLGIPAASQVLITPALGIYGFPHILFFQIFISHGGILLTAVYLTRIERLRPASWRSVSRVALWTILYALLIFFFNQWLGSNYLFLAYKPPAATLLDFLGPWPWYILSMIAIGLVLVVLLYLPFHRADRRLAASSGSAPLN